MSNGATGHPYAPALGAAQTAARAAKTARATDLGRATSSLIATLSGDRRGRAGATSGSAKGFAMPRSGARRRREAPTDTPVTLVLVTVMPEVAVENTVTVLDRGFLALDAALASDLAVVNGARVSFNQASEEMEERDAGLIRFLMRERHGSPFEHGYFRFIVKAPLFVVREHHRHRAGHCLPGSAQIWMETIAPRAGRLLRKRPIREIFRNWHQGVPDTLG